MPGGLRIESEENNGISALMSNMLTKGTKSKTAGQIALFFDSRGTVLHAYSGNNAFGLSMKALSQDFNESIGILFDCISSPSFDKNEFQKEKERVLAALRDEKDDIFAVSARALKETLFKVNPFKFQPQGTEESVDSLTRKEVADFYRRNFNPGNMVISVFGDVKTEDAVKKIEACFRGLKTTNRDILKEKVPAEPVFKETREMTKMAAKEQAVVMLGFLGPTIHDKDRYVFDIINSVLSGEKGRLFTEIREKGAMAYTTGSYTVEGIESGYFLAYAATSQKNLGRVKSKILEQIRLLCKKPLNEKELAQAKEELIGREKMGLQTETSLSFVASVDELYGLGFDDYTRYEANVRAVSALDVLKAANKYLNTEGFASVSILPEK